MWYVHNFATEDMPEMVVCYTSYKDVLTVIKSFEYRGIDYTVYMD